MTMHRLLRSTAFGREEVARLVAAYNCWNHRAWRADVHGLGGLAEFERELIRRRTTEGRERAKARGLVMGSSRN